MFAANHNDAWWQEIESGRNSFFVSLVRCVHFILFYYCNDLTFCIFTFVLIAIFVILFLSLILMKHSSFISICWHVARRQFYECARNKTLKEKETCICFAPFYLLKTGENQENLTYFLYFAIELFFPLMHHSVKFQTPPNAVDLLWSCEGLWRSLSLVFSRSDGHLAIWF